MAQYFLKAGAKPDARDNSGSTPLLHAVETGQLDLIRVLALAGADILAKNSSGESPLLASMKKGQAVLREILAHASGDKADSEGKTPLRHMVEARASSDMLALALGNGADPDSRDRMASTPLHAALALKDYAAAGVLLSAHADPFASDYQGTTPFALVLAVPDSLEEFVTYAGLASVDKLGESFLHYAVRAGKPDLVKRLLALGVDPELANISGETAYDVAKSRNESAIVGLFQK